MFTKQEGIPALITPNNLALDIEDENFKASRMEKLKAMMSPKANESNKKLQEDDMSSTKTSLNDAQTGNILNNTSSVI